MLITIPFDKSLASFLENVQNRQVAATQHEYLGVDVISKLIPNGTAICSSDSPYLVVQPAMVKVFPGLVQIDETLHFTLTPLSICCIIKDYGIKVNTTYDNHTTSETDVRGLIHRFGQCLGKGLGSLEVNGGGDLVQDVLGTK